MEAALMWVAVVLIGGSLLFIVLALITKPYRMRKQQRREAESRAKELTEIYGRVAVTRLKISGLQRATQRLEEARQNNDVSK